MSHVPGNRTRKHVLYSDDGPAQVLEHAVPDAAEMRRCLHGTLKAHAPAPRGVRRTRAQQQADDEALVTHPSWRAKRRLHAQAFLVCPHGRHWVVAETGELQEQAAALRRGLEGRWRRFKGRSNAADVCVPAKQSGKHVRKIEAHTTLHQRYRSSDKRENPRQQRPNHLRLQGGGVRLPQKAAGRHDHKTSRGSTKMSGKTTLAHSRSSQPAARRTSGPKAKQVGRAAQAEGPLHPSWTAAQQRKEAEQRKLAAKPSGTKVTFDD